MKQRFNLRLLAVRALGVKEGQRMPKWMSWVLYPIQNAARAVLKVNVEFETDCYIIEGIKVSREFIRVIKCTGLGEIKHEPDGSTWVKMLPETERLVSNG